MKRHQKAHAAALAAVLGALAIGAVATPAQATTYAINLSAPSTTSVGKPAVIQASGVKPPPEQFWYEDWITIAAISTSVLPACPASAQDAQQIAPINGDASGQLLAIALNPNSDAAGNFSNVVAYTPVAPGRTLICGYMYNEEGTTLVKATDLTLDVQPAATAPAAAPSAPPASGASGSAPPAPQGSAPAAPATTAAKPQNLDKPRLTRSRKALACSPGRWSNDPSGYEYGWLVDGRRARGATGPKLAVRARTHGHKVACSVTASNTAGATTSVSRALRVP